MQRIVSKIEKMFFGIIAISIALILAVICLQIICRFGFGSALSWPEEAARFLMVWALFLAAVYAMRTGEHVGLNFFVDKLNPSIALGVRIIMNILIIGFLGVVVYGGTQEVISLMPLKTGALRISRGIPYLILPISGVLFILVCIRLIVEDFRVLYRRHRL